MAKYLPHQIYTTIAEFSEELAAPIRTYLVGHIQRGATIEIIASRIDIKTKEDNELLIPLPSPIKHLLDNKYNEEIVLAFATQLGETIRLFSEGDTSDAEQEQFLKLRNMLKNVKTLNERQVIFFKNYVRGAIPSEALIKSIGEMVACGIPKLNTYCSNAVADYGFMLFTLADDGLNVWEGLGTLLKKYHPAHSIGYLMGEELLVWRQVAIAKKDVDNINVSEALHFALMLGIGMSQEGENVLDVDSPAMLALTNAMRRSKGADLLPFTYAKEFDLSILMTSVKQLHSLNVKGNTVTMFRKFDQLKGCVSRTLRSYLNGLHVKGAAVFSEKVKEAKTSSFANPMSNLIRKIHERQWDYLNHRIKMGDPVMFSYTTRYLHSQNCFDYVIAGTDSDGQTHMFKASTMGMSQFVGVHSAISKEGRFQGKSIIRDIDSFSNVEEAFGVNVYEATKEISWLSHKVLELVPLNTVFLTEQLFLSKWSSPFNDMPYGDNVHNPVAFREKLYKVIGSQGVQNVESFFKKIVDLKGMMIVPLPNQPMEGIAKGISDGCELDAAKKKVFMSVPTELLTPIPVEGGGESVVAKLNTKYTSKSGVPSVASIEDTCPKEGVMPMSISALNLVMHPTKFEYICAGKKGSGVTVIPNLLDVIYGGATSAGGYTCCMVVGNSYLGARYTLAARRLSLRFYEVVPSTPLGVRLSNLGFVSKTGYHSLHMAIEGTDTAKEVLNIIIQRLMDTPMATTMVKSAVLFF
ncbi:MAG: hypothetical protein RR280_00980 [Bacteroidaceae bacterium]